MKKYVFVFMLFVRSAFWKCMAAYALTAAAHTAFYFLDSGGWTQPWQFAQGSWDYVMAASLLLMTAALISGATGRKGKGKPIYTLARLEGGLPRAYLCQMAANVLYLLLFWCVNAVTLFVLLRLYLSSLSANSWDTQTLLLCFYDDPFLLSLIPMQDIALWLRNIVMILTLAAVMSGNSCRQRIGKSGAFGLGFTVALTVICFSTGGGEWQANAIIAGFFAFIFICSIGFNHSGKGVREDEFEETEPTP